MTPAEQIKARWPEITMMMVRLGYGAPGKKRFHALFRPDNNPSCEIWNNTIVDRSTGERFDVISLFARHHGISDAEAIKRLAAELPGREAYQSKPSGDKRKKLIIPPLSYCPEKAEALAKLRGVTREGVDFAAVTIGSLGFGEALGFDGWILTDGKNIAEVRRLDGEKLPAIGKHIVERKSHALGGSIKNTPIGLYPLHGANAFRKLPILLLEGGPDYLAACSILWNHEKFQPVAMLGAKMLIPEQDLPAFAGRDVLILAHDDESNAGVDGAKQRAMQLAKAGAKSRIRKMIGGDLNDLLKAKGAETIIKELLK
jgi:hypothetical protein